MMKKRSGDREITSADVAPVPAGSAANYKAVFAQGSASAFAVVFAEDVVLEAAGAYWPVSGRENVKRVMEAASKIYESLQFTDQAVDERARGTAGPAFGR
jgi:hypothetical protein